MNNTITHIRLLRQYFADLELIAQQQADLLGAAHTDQADNTIAQLMSLIEQRQQIMNQIDALRVLHKQAEPALQDAALFAAVRNEEAAIRASITAIQAHDEACRDTLRRFLQMAGAQLGQARKNIQALKYYTGSSEPADAHFFDRHK
ncbi:MAG: hypothetical protein ACOX0F_02025 [Syntrophomonadaceae bacterium]|jgi:hypothetical protein